MGAGGRGIKEGENMILRWLTPEGIRAYLKALGIEDPEEILKNPYQIMWEEFWEWMWISPPLVSWTDICACRARLEDKYKPKDTWLREFGGF